MTQELKLKSINLLSDSECVKFGKFTLKSGVQAPYYMNLRDLIPELRKPLCQLVVREFFPSPQDRENVALVGVPQGALCLSYSIAYEADLRHIYTPKEKKSYGLQDPYAEFDKQKFRLVIVDDVVSSGSSIQEMIDRCKEQGWTVKSVFVIIDREQGGLEKLRLDNKDVQFNSLFTISEVLDALKQSGRVSSEAYESALRWNEENKIKLDQ